MTIEVGKEYLFKGQKVKCTAKWASGKWYKYTFDNGFSFNGDPDVVFASGELSDVSQWLPPGKAVDIIANPDWKRNKMVPQLVEIPDFLKRNDNESPPLKENDVKPGVAKKEEMLPPHWND